MLPMNKIKKFYTGFKTRRSGSLLVYAVVALAVCVFIWGFSLAEDMLGIFGSKDKVTLVDIPGGTSMSGIAQILKDEGIIRHPVFLRVFERLGGDHTFQKGGHNFHNGQSYASIIKKLTDKPDVAYDETVTVLIPEGFEAWQIAKAFAKSAGADEKEFLRLLDQGDFDFSFVKDIERRENRLEGYLFPATYEVYMGESEYDIICRMLKAFQDNILPEYNKSGTEYSLDEIVTMASIVEREAANEGELGRVASVFYNRLKMDMAFGSCATVQYIIKERKAVLSNSDIKIKSDYNTYINKGLPIGPIASPGIAAVRAALYPEDTDYLYFAARADGSENVFSRTNEEHLRIVKQLQN